MESAPNRALREEARIRTEATVCREPALERAVDEQAVEIS